mgnify:CR=1 FL=1
MLQRNIIINLGLIAVVMVSSSINAAQSRIIPQRMVNLVKDAVTQMESLENEQKGLEKQGQNAIMNNDRELYAMVAEKNEKIETKKKKLRQETLVELNNIIGDGIKVPVNQEAYKDIFTIKEAVIKKAVWNPRQDPHVTIEMPVVLKRKIKPEERKYPVDFFGGSDAKVTRVHFYLGAGTFTFKTGKDQVVSLFANPKIPEMVGVTYGIMTNK